MATIHMEHTNPEELITITIGVVGFDLSSKDALIRLTVPGQPRSEQRVNMLTTYQGLTTDQKSTLNLWYRQQVAMGMNAMNGTSLTYADIPDTIFDPEPDPEEPSA